jgi:glycerol-1-phosphate dehydrogenase [NAD(P)+]
MSTRASDPRPAGAAAAAVRDLPALRARLAAAPDAAQLHPLGLRAVEIGPDVLGAVPVLVEELAGRDDAAGPVAVLADAVDIRRGDLALKPLVRELVGTVAHVRDVLVGGDGSGLVHADEHTLAAAEQDCAGARAIVSVGSGTVVDIGKAVAVAHGVPHVVVQTAASVNGYADDRSVLLVHGVKRTVETRWPDALVVDLGVLADTPPALTQAGLGDLLATFTAPADWRLAQLVGQDDSYSATAVAIAREHGDTLLALGPGVAAADPDALEELAAILTLSGVSMGVAGRTAPGSGMEHTVSHLIEMHQAAHSDDAVEALHGAKVGICTIFGALLWGRVRAHITAHGFDTIRFPTAAEMEPRVRAAFLPLDASGRTGQECWNDYARKLERWHASPRTLAALNARWMTHDRELGDLVADPAVLARALADSGAPTRLSDLGVDPDTVRWALGACHLMRDRFTVADLAFLLGVWEPDDVDAVVLAADELGVGR